MAPEPTPTLATTFAPGTKPTGIAGAPVIPATPKMEDYPFLDKVPPTNSSLVKEWIAKINWDIVPNHSPTTGECDTSPEAAADTSRCWWTCTGCVRETDITECPDKLTWGLSFDDGPSEYTPTLLNYLNDNDLTTTWFVVGSRVVTDPATLVAEYLTGHQISIHTWSHPALTSLTNEEIVAELAWTAKAIKDTIGVTPNTFRPPYGDIDDRVRAIAAQMGLTPIMWTAYEGTTFDTTDWAIIGGKATGNSSLERFEQILDTYAPKLDTGFIVLEHDLYQQTVDLAYGYFLPLALKAGFKLMSVIDCLGKSLSEAYIETSANMTTTLITSVPTGTFFQASVGPQATTAVTTTAANATATNGTVSGSVSGSANPKATAVSNVNVKSGALRTGASAALVLGAAAAAALL